uniref:Si:dkey-283b1.7 n=1 Tax=Cyclopterus lumpus TaxID=8103 RepID=A0A8C2ZSL6_CYCLU
LGCLSIALVLPLLLPRGPGRVAELAVAAEYSSKTDLDYEFGDYRGKWCIDDHGFVYGIGEVYHPSQTACPCTCTVDGPVCVRPKCPRIHPRCTRMTFKACCPVCEAMARVCVYGGNTYRPMEEFRLSRCERCRCEANREVYCSISDCPAPHCVNPTYEPNHCCPICKTGKTQSVLGLLLENVLRCPCSRWWKGWSGLSNMDNRFFSALLSTTCSG